MELIECIAVDDEPLAILQMKDFIGRLPGFSLQAAFSNGLEAMTYLQANRVDLLFLDIQMDDISGIQMLEAMKDGPVTILTTAYAQHALKGFELQVCDYLLKPISFERFVMAVHKAGKIIAARRGTGNVTEPPVLPPWEDNHIFIKSGYKLCRIRIGEILFIEGCGDYLKIHTSAGPVMTLISFTKLETMLPANEFIRVHRSFMIPMGKIRSIGKQWIVIGEKKIPLGDYYKQDFSKRFQKFNLEHDLRHEDPCIPGRTGAGDPKYV